MFGLTIFIHFILTKGSIPPNSLHFISSGLQVIMIRYSFYKLLKLSGFAFPVLAEGLMVASKYEIFSPSLYPNGYRLGQRVIILFVYMCLYVCLYLLILLQFCQSRGGIILDILYYTKCFVRSQQYQTR